MNKQAVKDLTIEVHLKETDEFKTLVDIVTDILDNPEIIFPQEAYKDYTDRLNKLTHKNR